MVGPHALINPQLMVENVMECDDDWPVPAGYLLVATDGSVGIGDTYDPNTHTFTKAPPSQDELDAETRGRIVSLAIQAMAQLQSIIDAPQISFSTVAQAQTQVRVLQNAVQYEAHVLRRLIRLAGGLLEGTD